MPRGMSDRAAGDWIPTFLSSLETTGNIRASCAQAGINRTTAYNAKEANAKFAARWDVAIEDAIDRLEFEAVRRAREGSDVLLIFMLKAARPNIYRDRVDVQHAGQVSFSAVVQHAATLLREKGETAKVLELPKDLSVPMLGATNGAESDA